MVRIANEPAAIGGTMQEAEPTVLGLVTASEENHGLGTSTKTTLEDKGLPRPRFLRQSASDEVGHQTPNTTAMPMDLLTHSSKPTVTQTADVSLSSIKEGEGVSSPQISPQPASDSSSSATDLGLHHTADPAVPPVDRSSTWGSSIDSILALADVTVPSVGTTGGSGGSPSVLGPTELPSLTGSMRTPTSMATAGMDGIARLGIIAAGKRFYRFIE
ncbi:hypothetical protein AAES_118147 [Amazona aestiva]|uniref:Uncharacterized protein n=1 Tax=Amazona aestiva TaxID=12930 RepID=A0A0Q3M685_AMAAE|nr:hypothetical protein AAES_118147 [Amazona aestiva]